MDYPCAMDQPVFYDASGVRRKWTQRAVAALLVMIVTASVWLAMTILLVPHSAPPQMVGERAQPLPLRHQIRLIGHRLSQWLPTGRSVNEHGQTIVGFYVPWDPDSRASLARNLDNLDWVVPALVSITHGGTQIAVEPDHAFNRIIAGAARRPLVLPMVQNAANDRWDGAGIAHLLADSARRRKLVDSVEQIVEAQNGGGILFDFEQIPVSAHGNYRRLLGEVRDRFARRGWLVTLAVPVGDPSWNLAAFARSADRLFVMNYDEHSPGEAAGPIASQDWYVRNLQSALRSIPARKAIIAIGNYGYDWHGRTADNMTVEEGWLAARNSGATISFDPASGNSGFSYEADGEVHTIWMLDAASAWNELRAIEQTPVAGVALWRLGSEDDGVWNAFKQFRSGRVPDLRDVPTVGNVDVEGAGELLSIAATPSLGERSITTDHTGLIRTVHWRRYPTPYVVQRGGYRPGMVALTFDDGPDAVWTPRILSILEARRAPATFFVIGENALIQPGLLNRILRGGSELGNHSYTHPNMANASEEDIRLELNANQRLVEAYTGRQMRLFRAPYFGDAEPTTADELVPALIAQRQGYLNVGLHVDPGDWKRPGVDAIVQRTLDQVDNGSPDHSAQIVLLHDGGGDRRQTVAALPRIIDGLRARGFTMVPVSQLLGVSPDAIMPRVTGTDLFAVRADVGVFLTLAGLLWITKWLFYIAITLGIGRALLMTALALRSRYRATAPPPPIKPSTFVSVLIPAFNEAKVIVGSIQRVLASTDVELEVIVIDDGSTDGTGDCVRAAFGSNARVRLLSLSNGGKARALNRGLELATADVIIALDADTQFEPQTIARLARWFSCPDIGAVAGNAKVGNRINLVTRWQAVEYVTAQNLERRALTQFDAITVVPGAVGAWRRAALDAVGGYPVDTLAEDQDLTIAIQRAGWRIGYDIDAVAWTEAPETFRALAKQRFRWAFGTLQCLWKHRAILRTRKPAGLALVGIPQAWMFQIGFAMISPIIDFALVVSAMETAIRIYEHGWAQTQSDVLTMAFYWLIFTGIDVVCGGVAYWLEKRERWYPAHLLVAQRFAYRQLMYWVVLRAVAAAVRGPWVGWGKLERTGRVTKQVV